MELYQLSLILLISASDSIYLAFQQNEFPDQMIQNEKLPV